MIKRRVHYIEKERTYNQDAVFTMPGPGAVSFPVHLLRDDMVE